LLLIFVVDEGDIFIVSDLVKKITKNTLSSDVI